jgi:hypothetical protein
MNLGCKDPKRPTFEWNHIIDSPINYLGKGNHMMLMFSSGIF